MDSELEFHCEERVGGYVVGQPDPACHFPQMWSFLIEHLELTSMFDIGCGEGHAMKFFADKGLHTFGFDGCQRAIDENVAPHKMWHDLYSGVMSPVFAFDLVWCCEVVEHIDESYLPNLMAQIRIADPRYIAITHAVPGQGGHYHVNCQDSNYWRGVFASHNYSFNEDLTQKVRLLANLEVANNHFGKSGLIFNGHRP